MVAMGWREDKRRGTADGYGVSLWSAKNILGLDSGIAQPCEYTKYH